MSANKSKSLDLLVTLKRRINENSTCTGSASSDRSKSCDESSSNSETDNMMKALFDLMDFISKADKTELTEAVRHEIDESLVKDIKLLKLPLIQSLRQFSFYRSFLGLPKTMEQIRRHLTVMNSKKLREALILHAGECQEQTFCDGSLCENILVCDDTKKLLWVEQVLVYFTGAGKFKKELGGFELKGSNKNTVKEAINKVKKKQQELDTQKAETKRKNTKKGSTTSQTNSTFVDTDIRIQERKREDARVSGMESMIDKALSSSRKK